MAIIVILAAVLTPNLLRQIELAEVRTEVQSLGNLATQMKAFASDTGAPTTTGTWAADLAIYSDLSPTGLATNRRARARVLLKENTSERYLFLSVISANPTLALPASATMATAQFQQIWNTADNTVPPVPSWAGWGAWAGIPNSAQLLIIQRVNLTTTLQTYPFSFRNNSTTNTARYRVILANGNAQTALPIDLVPGASVSNLPLMPRQRLELYLPAPGAVPYYTYVVSTSGKSFDYYDSTSTPPVILAQWRPQ